MSLQGRALHELTGDERFPTHAILQHWVHGAGKGELLHAMRYPTWPITAMWWLSEAEQRAIRARATVIAMVNELERSEVVMSGR